MTIKLKYMFVIVSGLILSACTQTVDMYFYSDESWKVSSRVVLDKLELQVMNWADDQIGDMDLPIQTDELVGGLTEGGLETLRSQYANVGIDFRWSGFGNTHSFIARGQTFEQFEKLIPGAIAVTKDAEDRYHLQADFTEAMLAASMFYHLDITLHADKIYSSNAVRQRGGTAQWTNPSTIDVVFSPTSSFPWGVLLAVCGVGLLGIIPFFVFAGKKKCPSCGKRVSKKSEYCTNCGVMMGGGSVGRNYF